MENNFDFMASFIDNDPFREQGLMLAKYEDVANSYVGSVEKTIRQHLKVYFGKAALVAYNDIPSIVNAIVGLSNNLCRPNKRVKEPVIILAEYEMMESKIIFIDNHAALSFTKIVHRYIKQ